MTQAPKISNYRKQKRVKETEEINSSISNVYSSTITFFLSSILKYFPNKHLKFIKLKSNKTASCQTKSRME
jgi:hypothetical protein